MKKTKQILAATVSVMCMAAAVGCGSSGSATTTAAAGTKSAETTKSAAADTKAAESTKAAAGGNLSGTVTTNGSTSMEEVIGALSEQFMSDNPGVTVTYDATGSGTGIEQASNGGCDIGLASRDLKDDEKAKGLEQTTIALDGIAIIVNENNPLEDISIDQIASIYTGETTNWKDVGGSDSEIAAIGREAGSGTRDGFESITGTKDKCKLSQELTSTGAVIEGVKNSPNAIGYASFSSVENQSGIKVLNVEGVQCSEDTIADGSYKIQRDFNLITKNGETLSPAAQAFYDYCTSADSADLISGAGVVPATKKN
ncbi:phosphate ABC transporter substrate-binding protein [Clostridium vitabionis]|uniref:phosphate ABC transporter substrate-binding protein n=1 Tax=Clostridium vitabionis TaxID=2784388 RepID=UPI00188D5CCD|nr:phosphate ABC transporter substrate-binding protein [Clostridium vitabionis]